MKVCSILIWFVWAASTVSAVTLQFQHAVYTALPGDSIEVRVSFNQPVPNGLLAYWLRMEYDDRVFDPASTLIEVAPALNFGFFEPPAIRETGAGHAAVRGFVDLDAPAYTGTSFLNFLLTVREDAPLGTYALTLVIPEPESFVDGAFNVLDDTITLGTATLEIGTPGDLNGNGVPDDWELGYYDSLDDVPETVTKRGRIYTIRQVFIAGLNPLDDSILELRASLAGVSLDTVEDRIYQIERRVSLTDSEGWVLQATLEGNGQEQTVAVPLEGFYRCRVMLADE